MKKIIITSLFIILSSFMFGQDYIISNKQLLKQDIDSIFTKTLKNKLQIDYAIYRVYEYNDKAGKHFIVMTKNITECKEQKECFNSIKAYCYSYKNDTFNLKWSLKDFILPNSYEYHISHWTKYFEIADYNKDGIVDPVIVYGTRGMNDTSDGRIKILTYYKDKKRAIRHQNGIHDNERNTQVDKEFYELPIEIQNRVKVIIENINENGHGIFPYGWQKEMKNKKISFDEN